MQKWNWPHSRGWTGIIIDDCWKGWATSLRQKQKKLIMLLSETMIWQPEFTDKTFSRKLGAVHQRFAGDDWDVWQCVLGAGGASVSAIVSPVWSPVKYRACPVAGLLRGTHFLLTKKSGRGRPLPLSNLLLKPYRLSVKVRAITSRCCSGVRELKRTA